MAIKGDPQTVRQMKKDILDTCRDLKDMAGKIRTGIRSSNSWDDDKAAAFNLAMNKVARMVESPVKDLQESTKKLERLAQLMDSYNKKSF